MEILSQLTKDQLTDMPALSRCHVRLTHWHGVMFPEEHFDGEALVVVHKLCLVAPSRPGIFSG